MLLEICWASWISFSSDTFLGILPSNSFSLLPQICLQTWANTATVPPHLFIFKTVTSAKAVAHHSKLSESFFTRYSLHWLGRTSLWTGHESSTRLSDTDSHHFNPKFQQFLKHKPFSDCCMLLVHFQDAEMVDSERGRAGLSILSCFIAVFWGERVWQSLFTQSLLEAAFQSWFSLKIKHTHWKTMSKKMPELKRGTVEKGKTHPATSLSISTRSKSPKVAFQVVSWFKLTSHFLKEKGNSLC